jgi:hypothetical protein
MPYYASAALPHSAAFNSFIHCELKIVLRKMALAQGHLGAAHQAQSRLCAWVLEQQITAWSLKKGCTQRHGHCLRCSIGLPHKHVWQDLLVACLRLVMCGDCLVNVHTKGAPLLPQLLLAVAHATCINWMLFEHPVAGKMKP